ncbi:MAG: hypothetical protein DMF02_00605 [Verrucomicrobia bacterium]|nr:MAG: hypothetical protein DMF02_00605 [Verrucomicrobiota bacterium]
MRGLVNFTFPNYSLRSERRLAVKARLKTARIKKLPLTSRAASSSQALAPVATPQLTASRSFYGVGAGDSAGDGEGDSVEPSVFGGVFLAAL